MDAVEDLDLDLDTHDGQSHYDYLSSAVLSCPKETQKTSASGKTDTKPVLSFKGDCHELRVSHITDAHFPNRRSLVKFAPLKAYKSTSKPDIGKDDVVYHGDFAEWSYDANPRYVIPIYKPGDIIKGRVILQLKRKLEADRLVINLLGRATASIRIHHDYGHFACFKHHVIIDETLCLWQSAEVPDESGSTSLVDCQELGEGVHELPFQFTIPQEAPGSVVQLMPKSHDLASLSYRLKVTVEHGRTSSRGNAVTGRGVWVERPVNVASLTDVMRPVEAQEELHTGMFSSGNIILKVRLPRSAYARNEEVPVTIEVDNKSGSAIDKVEARIILTGRGITGGERDPPVKFDNKAICKCDGPVADGVCRTFDVNLPFDFSQCVVDSSVLPTSETAEISNILDFRYEVVVKLKRGVLHRDIHLNIPVIVGTQNDPQLSSLDQ